jgi:hypothetical protein
MMTDEEKVDLEKEMNSSKPGGNLISSGTSDTKSEAPSVTPSLHDDNPSAPGSTSPSVLPPAPTAADKDRERREAAQRKAEQREKIREQDKARRKAMEERVAMLTKKMIERLRPFVEAKDPGGSEDPESTAFAEKMKREVEDLKLESFGVEVFLVLCSLIISR